MRSIALLLFSLAISVPSLAQMPPRPGMSERGLAPDPSMPRPIAARDSVWIEQLTWMEVRDALASGKTTVIIATGGVEQNGPYVAAGKHNLILRATAEAIARKLGNALVSPIVPFVPEGNIDPPTSHMRYPSTISLEESTFRALLRDIARSHHINGFRNVVFIGDSLTNQEGMKAVADELDNAWRSTGARAIYVPEYYDWDDRAQWLAARGYKEIDEGIHDELSVEAIIMTVDPGAIRLAERQAAGLDSINGVKLTKQVTEAGHELVNHIAEVTAEAARRRLGTHP